MCRTANPAYGIACWGVDDYGQATPPDTEWESVDSGWYHACAIDILGQMECWGKNNRGQTSFDTTITYKQVSGGYEHTCAITESNTVSCFGWDSSTQSTPPSGTFTQVSAGYNHTCGLTLLGTIKCWGDDTYIK